MRKIRVGDIIRVVNGKWIAGDWTGVIAICRETTSNAAWFNAITDLPKGWNRPDFCLTVPLEHDVEIIAHAEGVPDEAG